MKILAVAGLIALATAGAATAYTLGTIYLSPGKCAKVAKTRVCARAVRPVTVTVAPSPIGQTFSGNGDETLAPLTVSHGVEAHWTAQPDSFGFNDFSVSSSLSDTTFLNFDNGNSATSGQTYIPPGTYTFSVTAAGAWTISF